MNIVAVAVACAVSAAAASAASAHHSPSAFDVTTEVTVEGTITELEWKNPHTYVAQAPVVLAPGASFSFNSGYFEIDAQGVSFDPADLPATVTGKVRFIAYPDF